MDKTTDTELPENGAVNEWMELVKTAVLAVLVAVIIRSFLFEPFNIPSGSMKPNLLVGDYLFVSKFSYGYTRFSVPYGLAPIPSRIWDTEPTRGDVVVFKLPTDTSIDYIKRVIGMPGDTIQMRGGQLFINRQLVPREFVQNIDAGQSDHGDTIREYVQTLPNGVQFNIWEHSDNGRLDNTRLFTVPEGHYFVMGDNRDASVDSRVFPNPDPLMPSHNSLGVGFVPYENILGRADIIFFSTNGTAALWEPWKWPWTIRYERLFDFIK
jgi:signal peptidase I